MIKPTRVEVRYSTDILVVDVNEVRTAMHFIRQNISQPITVDDVAYNACLSRRSLERRFKKYFDRSIHDEICRC